MRSLLAQWQAWHAWRKYGWDKWEQKCYPITVETAGPYEFLRGGLPHQIIVGDEVFLLRGIMSPIVLAVSRRKTR